MARLVRFAIEGGGEVYVEAADEDVGALVARDDGAIEAPRSFDDAVAQVRPVTEALMRQIGGLVVKPDEITVELGISLKANAGVILASIAAEGALKLTLKWKPGSGTSGG